MALTLAPTDIGSCILMHSISSYFISFYSDEKVRRYELANHKVSVNIFYNGKHVSTSEPSMFDNSDFRVQIQQMFNMQIVHSPENIMLEVCFSCCK